MPIPVIDLNDYCVHPCCNGLCLLSSMTLHDRSGLIGAYQATSANTSLLCCNQPSKWPILTCLPNSW